MFGRNIARDRRERHHLTRDGGRCIVLLVLVEIPGSHEHVLRDNLAFGLLLLLARSGARWIDGRVCPMTLDEELIAFRDRLRSAKALGACTYGFGHRGLQLLAVTSIGSCCENVCLVAEMVRLEVMSRLGRKLSGNTRERHSGVRRADVLSLIVER